MSHIKLDNFQEFVPSRIYWRGVEYHTDHAVTSLHKTNSGKWHATVCGSEDYDVYISIHPDGRLNWECNCPYDGVICKHVVATLLTMQERGIGAPQEDDKFEDDDFGDDDFGDADFEEDAAKEDDELERLLAVANKDDLADFLRQRTSGDMALRNALVSHIKIRYIQPEEDDSTDYIDLVRKTISSCVTSHRTRYDYYDETDWDDVVYEANMLVDKGEKLLRAGNARSAVTIAIEVLESIDHVTNESIAFEEDADISGACEAAGELLLKAIDSPSLSKALQREVIDRVRRLTESELEDYDYFDFSELTHQLSVKVLDDDDAIALLDNMIDSAQSYQKEHYVHQKINLLNTLGRTQERDATIDKYIHLPQVRKLRMNEHIAAGRYADALRVIADGITQAQSDGLRGVERDWLECKLEVLELMSDTAAQIDLTRQFFLYDDYRVMDYYHKLKQLVPPQQWRAQLADLLAGEHHLSFDTLAQIHTEEKDYDQLMALVRSKQRDRLDAIIHYAVYLQCNHSAELIQLLNHDIRAYAEHNLGRNHYEHLADALRVMRNLNGGQDAATALAADLCATYPRRRAMVEILTRPKR